MMLAAALGSNHNPAQELEDFLGNPSNAQNISSFARAIELDEREDFPEATWGSLCRWGLPEYFIPAEEGGRLTSFQEAISILRIISRRDLTVAIAGSGTYLAAIHVWIAGSAMQKERVAELIRSGRSLAFALTEREHGSDILASEVNASRSSRAYVISGEKWLISNARRATAVTVFARTCASGGPRGFSLFLVDKEALDPSTYEELPKVRTLGIRGADISGIRFRECTLPEQACIGLPGSGLETALKGLMVTRTLCAGFSLGAADTALRITLEFSLKRFIYGQAVWNIPCACRSVLHSFLDLLTCDCVALLAGRGLHVVPQQSSIWSAVTKYFVPMTVENLIRELSVVLGARYYLREGMHNGVFQKILRDCAVVGLFDGSTAVNLNAIVLQLSYLLSQFHGSFAGREEVAAHLQTIADLDQPLPAFQPHLLSVFAHGKDDLLQGLHLVPNRLAGLESKPDADQEAVGVLKALTHEIIYEVEELVRALAQISSTKGMKQVHRNPKTFDLAKRYCILHAAAACLHVWTAWRGWEGPLRGGQWVALCLDRLLGRLQGSRRALPPRFAEAVSEHLLMLHRDHRLFSIQPLRLSNTEH